MSISHTYPDSGKILVYWPDIRVNIFWTKLCFCFLKWLRATRFDGFIHDISTESVVLLEEDEEQYCFIARSDKREKELENSYILYWTKLSDSNLVFTDVGQIQKKSILLSIDVERTQKKVLKLISIEWRFMEVF